MVKQGDSLIKFVLCLIIICSVFHLSVGDDQAPGEGEAATTTTTTTTTSSSSNTMRERLKSMFSLSSTSPFTTTITTSSSYWDRAKMLVQQGHAYIFPPNLEGSEDIDEVDEGGGAGKKVKEAVTKSMEKSKSTVEDSAKSAAKFAEDTVHKTADKVKKTLSGKSQPEPNDQEL